MASEGPSTQTTVFAMNTCAGKNPSSRTKSMSWLPAKIFRALVSPAGPVADDPPSNPMFVGLLTNYNHAVDELRMFHQLLGVLFSGCDAPFSPKGLANAAHEVMSRATEAHSRARNFRPQGFATEGALVRTAEAQADLRVFAIEQRKLGELEDAEAHENLVHRHSQLSKLVIAALNSHDPLRDALKDIA